MQSTPARPGQRYRGGKDQEPRVRAHLALLQAQEDGAAQGRVRKVRGPQVEIISVNVEGEAGGVVQEGGHVVQPQVGWTTHIVWTQHLTHTTHMERGQAACRFK